MLLVGLTGGIGSGKSTVAARLEALGAVVIDADAIAREIVEPGEPALADLVARFGPGILQADGRLDRAGLAAIVFADADARTDLERATHPRVAARIAERIATIAAGPDAADALVVVDHPLLLETEQAARFDAVLVVLADEEERVRRLAAERGLDPDDARARMRAQVDDAARRAAATHVLENDGSRDDLLAEVDRVHAMLVGGEVGAD